jgi:hypothetical protein
MRLSDRMQRARVSMSDINDLDAGKCEQKKGASKETNIGHVVLGDLAFDR